MVDNDRSADIVRPATIIEGLSSHALLDLQNDQSSDLEIADDSLLGQARRTIAMQKSKGYAFALIYMTAEQKDASVEQDVFAALRDEGYSVFPGKTPDFSLFEKGDPACEFTKIVWPRAELPDWALPAKTKPTTKRAKPKKAGAKTKNKALVAEGAGTSDVVDDQNEASAMTAHPTPKRGKKRRDSST